MAERGCRWHLDHVGVAGRVEARREGGKWSEVTPCGKATEAGRARGLCGERWRRSCCRAAAEPTVPFSGCYLAGAEAEGRRQALPGCPLGMLPEAWRHWKRPERC